MRFTPYNFKSQFKALTKSASRVKAIQTSIYSTEREESWVWH